jgi:tetratricopeptide (TPR) repeat protein
MVDVPPRPEGFKGGIKAWLRASKRQFLLRYLRLWAEKPRDKAKLAEVLADYQVRLLIAAELGFEFERYWNEVLLRVCGPAERFYTWRAYEARAREPIEIGGRPTRRSRTRHFDLGIYADRIGYVYEHYKQWQDAAEWYRRARCHFLDGADDSNSYEKNRVSCLWRLSMAENSLRRVTADRRDNIDSITE